MSIITTGINIVATGVSQSINEMQRFGQAIQNTHRQAQTFANGYNSASNQVKKSGSSLSNALNANWQGMYDQAKRSTKNQERELRRLSSMYDRTFREIGNKYQSMVMGSVALSMSGIGLKNMGTSILGSTKVALDQARDFETVMSQIQFYGHRTAEEMESINKQIFKLGYDLPVTTSEIANSVLSAQKLGYDDIKDAMKMAEEASKIQFMSLGNLDGDESLKYISHMRKLTGYAIEDVDTLTDKLTKTADVSAASIDSLWKTIQSSRTAFDSLNTDEDTFLALAGVMADRLTPRNAGMALNSFAGGLQMGEKAAREDRGSRGAYYKELMAAMGGKNYDDFGGDTLAYVDQVAKKSKEIWGEGTERSGILQSIFGKSAIDLFYAVDAYSEQTGRSMVQMREEIKNSDGHAQQLMDTLMNGSYGTEKRLEAMIEQFQILFGTAIRPAFNAILDGLTALFTKVNQFMEAHPKLTKALGYGVGIAGALLVATGATMLAVGGFLALYSSIGNVIIQIARNTRVLNMLSQGYSTAGAMLRGKMLGPLKLLGVNLLKLSGITLFLWMAWKNDFLRMRTTFTEWKDDISKGLGESQRMFELYAQGSRGALMASFSGNMQQGGLDNWIANTWTKVRMLWDGIKDAWSDGTLSPEKHQMLTDAGLIGTVEKVLELKAIVTDFWKGFQSGMKDGLELLKTLVQPLLDVWDWVSEKVLKLFQHFGYFENVNKGIGSQWEQWGQKAGYILGSAIAIRVALWGWLKAIKMIASPFKLIHKLASGIFGMFSKLSKLKLSNIAKLAGKLLAPKGVRQLLNTGNYMAQKKFSRNTRQGAQSRLPYARQIIDPTTGKPTGQVRYQRKWYQRNNRGETIIPSRDGRSNSTKRSRGMFGRMKDLWRGEAYVPETRTDRRGRTYHQVRNRNGGVTRTSADGRVNGRQLRTGGVKGWIGGIGERGRNNRQSMNARNFRDAGMNYVDSVQRKGHKTRSVKAAAKGWWNRQQRLGITATGGRYGGGYGGSFGGAGGASKGAGSMLKGVGKGAGKGIGKLGGTLGKGLIKGLGGVVTKGLPLLFKGALRAIPFLGWALMAWDIISAVFSNWDAIKNGAGIAWDWIKEKGAQVWELTKQVAGIAWDWVKLKAGEIWQGVVTLAQGAWDWIKGIASSVWTAILGFGSMVWTSITTIASGVWTAILGFGTTVWNSISSIASTIWEGIKGFASAMWTAMTGFAQSAWDSVTGIASGVIETVKGYVNGIFDGLYSAAESAWSNVKKFFTDNPITQTIKTVTEKVTGGGKGKGARTGEWYVPRDNMPYNLHQGEMVLKRNEAQILRSMVGSDSNSISRYLLDKNEVSGSDMSIKAPSKKILRPQVKVAEQPQAQQTSGGGDTKIEVSFAQGAIQVANASASEMKKGAKQMFEEFKRMVELDNMKHYKSARPRTR